MARNPGTETVKRWRATGIAGRHGEEPPKAPVEIIGCAVIPRTSTELVDGQNTVIVGSTLFAPGGTDISASDEIEWPPGRFHEVEGEPGDYRKRGQSKAIVVALKRVRG